MFRKIHSNRDPTKTVWSELRSELRPHYQKTRTGFQTMLTSYPRTAFGIMAVSVVLSAALSFTVFRHPANSPPAKQPVKIMAPVSSGISQVMQAGEELREMLRLKKTIDSLSVSKQLTASDSATLERALDRFNQLNKEFNPKK